MSLEAFEQIVQQLSVEDLRRARALLDELIARLSQELAPDSPSASAAPGADVPSGPERRRDPRFPVNLQGLARPLVSARGEKNFPITIVDLSRSGLRFIVDANTPLYPLAEITFTGPTGRIRNVYTRLVRLRMIIQRPDNGPAVQRCEIAARAIDAKELEAVQQRHRRLMAVSHSLRNPKELPVFLLGGGKEAASFYQSQLASKDHPVTIVAEPAQLPAALHDEGPQVVVYLEGEQALLSQEMTRRIHDEQRQTVQVAIIRRVEDRRPLLDAGMDECVHQVNAEALLGMYIERALKAKLTGAGPAGAPTASVTRVLMGVEDNLPLAQLGMACHRDDFQVAFSYDVDGMLALLRCTEVDALVLDTELARRDGWANLRQVRQEFTHLPVIVAVQDLKLGPQALANGATEYLVLPTDKRDLMVLVASAQRITEYEAAQANAMAASEPAG